MYSKSFPTLDACTACGFRRGRNQRHPAHPRGPHRSRRYVTWRFAALPLPRNPSSPPHASMLFPWRFGRRPGLQRPSLQEQAGHRDAVPRYAGQDWRRHPRVLRLQGNGIGPHIYPTTTFIQPSTPSRGLLNKNSDTTFALLPGHAPSHDNSAFSLHPSPATLHK